MDSWGPFSGANMLRDAILGRKLLMYGQYSNILLPLQKSIKNLISYLNHKSRILQYISINPKNNLQNEYIFDVVIIVVIIINIIIIMIIIRQKASIPNLSESK